MTMRPRHLLVVVLVVALLVMAVRPAPAEADVLTALASAAASADDPLFYTVTYVEVVPPSTAGGASALRQYGEASRRDPGARRVEVLQRIDRPSHFAVLATWKDQKAFEAHRAAAPMTELRDKLQAVLASPNDERSHQGLSVAPPVTGAGTVFVVTHVVRSEERRVGKECRSRWSPYH